MCAQYYLFLVIVSIRVISEGHRLELVEVIPPPPHHDDHTHDHDHQQDQSCHPSRHCNGYDHLSGAYNSTEE